jgi:DNA repair protein RadC
MAVNEIRIRHPEDINSVVRYWAKRKEENFLVMTLNGVHEIIKVHHITKGLVNKTIVHPRECFYPAIKDYASSVAFVHNHPSGNIEPSPEDRKLTDRLCMAGSILGFNVLDHVTISPKGGYYSFRRDGSIYDNYTQKEKSEFVSYLAAEKEGNDKF